jgi:hypothetical protein
MPPHPCPYCRSEAFVRLKAAEVELYRGGAHQGSACPSFELLMCTGCGKTDWFADVAMALEYFGSLGEPVTAAPASTRAAE